jgi:hypothetical protein
MLNILDHKGNANLNHIKIPPHPDVLLKIKNISNNKYWQGGGENGTLIDCWVKCKLVQPLWKTVWRLPRKLKIDLLYDPAIPLPGI